MKVFDRGASLSVSVIALTMIWAAFVVPGGATWMGLAWTSALVALLVGASVVLIGTARSPLMIEVIDDVEGERTGPGRARPLGRRPR